MVHRIITAGSRFLTFRIATALFAISACAGDNQPKPERPELYGCPWGADSLGNLQIGLQPGRKVGIRFRAEHSGIVEKVTVFLVFHAPGYYMGDGGQVLAEFQVDDDSESHLPSGTAFASCLIEKPMTPTHPWSGTGVGYPELRFDKPVTVEAGKLYHIVFTNPSSDPLNNYVSLDDLYQNRRRPNMQPAISDVDLAILYKFSEAKAWELNLAHTPIFCVYYAGGARQGQGYVNARSQSALCRIDGENTARQVFTVTGRDRTVTSAAVRLRRKGAPGELIVRLEDAAGAVLESVRVPSEHVPEAQDWVACEFMKPHLLKAGSGYRLVLSTPAGHDAASAYEIHPLQEGIPHGLGCPSVFTDGYFEATDASNWQGNRQGVDMQFYFTVAPESPANR